ncbi:MAG: hypothetical protein ACRDRN_20660 [Sciscionella sp.]
MAVTATNILAGAGSLYYASFGATFPADSAATVTAGAPAGFTDFGGTSGGVDIMASQKLKMKKVDQVLLAVGAYPTDETIQLKTSLAEATVQNLNVGLNNKFTITPQATYTTADWNATVNSQQLTYISLIFDGWAPTLASGAAARRRLCAYKVLSEGTIGAAYKVDDQVRFACTFDVFFVSGSQTPFHCIDQTA